MPYIEQEKIDDMLHEISELKHFAGSEMLMSDFQTAGDMRKEIDRLRARVEELELIIRDQWIATLGEYVTGKKE